tara:strand:+ start:342 stop:1040 length:699 start_codon:yes stop_codon:yes gene_type:complete
MKSKRILGVIPARGGSKGIKNKNIIDLDGSPLISHTIKAGLKSTMLTDCIVSTDSEAIKNIAEEFGANVPFKRPDELSSDLALPLPVMQHAVKFMEKLRNYDYDAVVMLQPTTPLRLSDDIDKSLELLFETNADSVISVVVIEANHPFRMKRIIDGRLVNYIDQGYEDMRPRQVLPPVYIRNGAIYATKRDILINTNSFTGNDVRAYVMPAERSVNIDSMKDYIIAKNYFNK